MTDIFTRTIVFFLCYLLLGHLSAQKVVINEIVASNSKSLDEDGDTPDWIELYNQGEETVSLENWQISDNLLDGNFWNIPAITIPAESYLVLWASGKNRFITGFARTLINQSDTFRYMIPSAPIGAEWLMSGFDDSNWKVGETGLGYGDGDDKTIIPQGTQSVFLRKSFQVSNLSAIQQLLLDIDYDDGFVAYINGIEIGRANINGTPPAYNARTIRDREAEMHRGGKPERYLINNINSIIQEGENILAIQAHNTSTNSSDFSVIPFLSAISTSALSEGVVPPPVLELVDRRLHTDFKISSKEETIYLFNENGTLVDSLSIRNLPPDVSYGYSEVNRDRKYYQQPTPGYANPEQGFLGINGSEITFSHNGGAVSPLSLSLSGEKEGEVIRYTLDATEPNISSAIYETPLSINNNTVVRARIFQEDYIPSKTQSHTYLVNISHDLPIISLVTAPEHLFDNESGIYVKGDNANGDFPHFGSNFWEDWERPVNFTLYEKDSDSSFSFDGGMKIFGGWSRGNEQKSFSIFARNQYGVDEIEYPLFPDLPFDEYQSFVMRNSGNDWLNTMMRDGVLTGLMNGADLEHQAFRPTVTYINGTYWGIYNMREKVNEHFLAARHDLDVEEINILEANSRLIYGSDEDYRALISYVNQYDLSDDQHYEYVAEQIDLDNYATYQAAQIFFDNTDWPGNNIKYWKADGGKWRWVLYDTDFGFGVWNVANYQNNTLAFALRPDGNGWPNPAWSTLLFRSLLKNTGFRNLFINRFADEMNSRFLPTRVRARIDSLASNIASEVPQHYSRWNGSSQFWASQVNNMRIFANARPGRMKFFIRNQFALVSFYKITLLNSQPTNGYIKVNSLDLHDEAWSGDYFQGVPIKVSAIPEPGYTFSHWIGEYNSTKEELDIDLESDATLTAHFRESTPEDEVLVINEINYHSSDDFDTGDWVEIYNGGNHTINISGWELKDSKDDNGYVFPEKTIIPAKGYLVVARSLKKFQTFYPNLEYVVGDMSFGLSSSSDAVRLFDRDGVLRDEFVYDSSTPGQAEANGNGPTLELLSPSLDNSLPNNWGILHDFGSPGEANVEEDTTVNIGDFSIDQLSVYPNPFNDRVNLTFTLGKPVNVEVALYDTRGAKVYTIFEGALEPGDKHLVANLDFLGSGMYILEFKDDTGFVQVLKWLKMRE